MRFNRSEPYLVAGSGQVVAHLHRYPADVRPWAYRFQLFRCGPHGEVTQRLRPADLQALVKLCQVLAFSIADDGWLPECERQALQTLSRQLDRVTQTWSDDRHG